MEVTNPVKAAEGSLLTHRQDDVQLLLLAGGTGITAWLPSLSHAQRPYHLVWCVQTKALYNALADRLPPVKAPSKISVFITRSASASCPSTTIIPLTSLPSSHCTLSPAEPLLNPRHLHTRRVLAPTSAGWLAASVGLSIGFAWNSWLRATRAPPLHFDEEDLFSYVIVRRMLPILVIVVVVMLTASLERRIIQRWRESHHPLVPFISTSSPSFDGVGADKASSKEYEFIEERPDVVCLVRTAVEAAREARHRLVVASSGPSALVGAVKSAVTQQRKRSGTEIEFVGVRANW